MHSRSCNPSRRALLLAALLSTAAASPAAAFDLYRFDSGGQAVSVSGPSGTCPNPPRPRPVLFVHGHEFGSSGNGGSYEANFTAASGPSFKGAYVRGLGRLNSQLSDHPYGATLGAWANSAYAHDRNVLDQYGPHWAGGSGTSDYGCQQSVLDLLNAAP